MILEVYPAGIYQANCYIIGDEETKLGAVIDPGGNEESILNECERLGIKVEYIILTHGHGDHIGGVAGIKERTGAKILMNNKDEFLTQGATRELLPILRNIKLFDIDQNIEDGDIIKLGNIELRVIETPGHTPGGVCLSTGNVVFTGDTLFHRSIGRTDFEGGSFEKIISSIKEKLLVLPEETIVYPGHGESSTIFEEKRYNPFV